MRLGSLPISAWRPLHARVADGVASAEQSESRQVFIDTLPAESIDGSLEDAFCLADGFLQGDAHGDGKGFMGQRYFYLLSL